MKSVFNIIMIVLAATVPALPVLAQHEGHGETQEMHAFGPPAEMKQVAGFVGSWKYQGEMRMDPNAEWTKHDAAAVFTLVCGGAALQMDFTGNMMGMEMKGLSLTGFDRETGKWQGIWTDNFAGRMSYYEGDFMDGRLVHSGKDLMQGMTMFTRTTYYDITDKTMNWMMENSMDGQTWFVSMRGTYTRQ
ncbi:MAG: DUF1579 family protein [Candidatus Zixiibacteriota bacterium]